MKNVCKTSVKRSNCFFVNVYSCYTNISVIILIRAIKCDIEKFDGMINFAVYQTLFAMLSSCVIGEKFFATKVSTLKEQLKTFKELLQDAIKAKAFLSDEVSTTKSELTRDKEDQKKKLKEVLDKLVLTQERVIGLKEALHKNESLEGFHFDPDKDFFRGVFKSFYEVGEDMELDGRVPRRPSLPVENT
ncbi:hypothetical protein VNO78_17869 [Psophocarpus tetragonolobus]|uniref:Uncharacterized protein n=1 Tax=Psophocarpus tetragonolobus TaxID=3891 RepID=A0AAN9SIT8_PSOTE